MLNVPFCNVTKSLKNSTSEGKRESKFSNLLLRPGPIFVANEDGGEVTIFGCRAEMTVQGRPASRYRGSSVLFLLVVFRAGASYRLGTGCVKLCSHIRKIFGICCGLGICKRYVTRSTSVSCWLLSYS